MFNKKEEPRVNTYELQVENEKLRIKAETLEFKLEQMNEKYSVLEDQLRKAKSTDIEKIKTENESLKKEIEDWKFKAANDTSNIEMATENLKLKAQVEIQNSENKHLKELLDAYRAMPDVKNMVDSLSSLAVPHMEELKEFSKIVSDSKVVQLCEELAKTNSNMGAVIDNIRYSMRGYR